MDYSTPGFPVVHHVLEFAQIHVHWYTKFSSISCYTCSQSEEICPQQARACDSSTGSFLIFSTSSYSFPTSPICYFLFIYLHPLINPSVQTPSPFIPCLLNYYELGTVLGVRDTDESKFLPSRNSRWNRKLTQCNKSRSIAELWMVQLQTESYSLPHLGINKSISSSFSDAQHKPWGHPSLILFMIHIQCVSKYHCLYPPGTSGT